MLTLAPTVREYYRYHAGVHRLPEAPTPPARNTFHAIAAMWTTRGCLPLVAAREQPELRRPQQFLILDLGHPIAPVQQPVDDDALLVAAPPLISFK